MLPKYIKNHHFIPLLDTKQIDIWQFCLNDLTEEARNLLNQEEKQRADRYHFDRHRRRFTVARAKMRQILASYLPDEMDASTLEFHLNEYGKPGIVSASQLEFNLSHSGEMALLAVGKTFPLGVDLEFFSGRNYLGIAKNLFSEAELETFTKLPDYCKPQAFFHVWAQKEAFIKACGMGLSYPTQQFSVPVLAPSDTDIYDPIHKMHWKMQSFMPLPGCSAAICHHPCIEHIRLIID